MPNRYNKMYCECGSVLIYKCKRDYVKGKVIGYFECLTCGRCYDMNGVEITCS